MNLSADGFGLKKRAMNPPPKRLTVVEIHEPLTRLEAEYRIYREALERYHAHTENILSELLGLLTGPKLKEGIAIARSAIGTLSPRSKAGKANGPKASRTSEMLTRREVQVLGLIASGHSTKQLASALGITFKTAVGHRSSLMKKLSIHDTASLVRYAIRNGLIDA